MATAMRGDSGNSGSSSARYDNVNPGSIKDWSSPAGQAYMRDFAEDGVSFAS
jgi:hypothetical protein